MTSVNSEEDAESKGIRLSMTRIIKKVVDESIDEESEKNT